MINFMQVNLNGFWGNANILILSEPYAIEVMEMEDYASTSTGRQ